MPIIMQRLALDAVWCLTCLTYRCVRQRTCACTGATKTFLVYFMVFRTIAPPWTRTPYKRDSINLQNGGGKKKTSGCWSDWPRLAFRPLVLLDKTRKHAAEPRDCPSRPPDPQRIGVRVGVRVGVSSGVGLSWADVQD